MSDALGARLAAVVGVGHVIAIDASSLLDHVEAATVCELEPPDGDAIALPDAPCDGALVGGLGGASPLALASALAARVRVGGSVTFVLPTTRPGLKGRAGSLLGLVRRKRPVMLEELCEALLLAGLHAVEARELDDALGTSLVTATVR